MFRKLKESLIIFLFCFYQALETYKTVHRKFPENIECLKFLVKLSSDMGLREAGEYAMDLKKAERWRSLFIYLFNDGH